MKMAAALLLAPDSIFNTTSLFPPLHNYSSYLRVIHLPNSIKRNARDNPTQIPENS